MTATLRARLLGAAAALSLGAGAAALGAGGWPESVERLRAYVRIDTSNPPGNEIKGTLFLKDLLAREGVEAELFEPEPGRANLVARLRGSGRAPGLVLHHHV